jgi:hypothetical protein
LEEGLTWNEMSIAPEAAQFLQSRNFQIEEIARWFRMPLHKIQHLAHATFSNIEHQSIEFYTDCIRPWLVRWEQEINRKLFLKRSGYYCEHVVDGILRGDSSARYAVYNTALQNGVMNRNEVRALENLNSIGDGGDIYTVQQNLTKLEQIGEQQSARPNGPQNDTPADDKASADRARAAFHIVACDGMARVIAKETKALSRAKGDVLKAAGDFYETHAEYVLKVLEPTAKALCVAVGCRYEPDAVRAVAESHITQRMTELASAQGTGRPLDSLFDDWEADVPQAVASELVRIAND